MIKYLFLSILSILLTISSHCQTLTDKSSGKLLLKNHTITLSEIEKPEANQLPSFDGYTYFIAEGLNHVERPSSLEYKTYLPKNAALFRVQNESLASALAFINEQNTAYTALHPSWKLSNRLFSGDIPEWAWLSDKEIKVLIRVYPGVNLVKAKVALTLAGETILATDAANELITLSINVDKATSLANYPFVMQVQEMEDPGTPENWTARTSHRINYLQSEIPNKTNYDGTGVTLSLGDDGVIGPHIDYTGRLDQSSAGSSTGDHGDHVAGTIFGAGNIDPRGRGMAPGLDMIYYSYPGNLNAVDNDYNTNGVVITSSSYSNGCNGGYTNFTAQMDNDYAQNPNLIHVFSAGNSGTSNCGYGAGAGWGNITGGHKIAKNVIAVANLTNLDALASSSSRGPASDGRIKPDVGAVGTSVYSTTDVNSYTLKTGTSMSCPGTSGTISVLYQAYKEINAGVNPNGALIKAILMNTAEDLGNPGPDFKNGYGRINARRALEVIENEQFVSGSLTNGGSTQHTINIPANVSKAKMMVYWGDVAASTVAARALVNDLDMTVTSGGTTIMPWVLDPTPNATALNNNAVRARDSLNNVEQVTIDNPAAGQVTVNVNAFDIPQGSQTYYVIFSFEMDTLTLTHPIGGEKFVPGTTEIIRWDGPTGTNTHTIEYSIDNGSSWLNVASNVAASQKYYNWNVPNTITGEAKVRVINGNTSTSPDNFTIIGVPQNVTYISACTDTLTLSWDLVDQAIGYVIYRLGNKYMDSIGYTVSSVFTVPNIPIFGDEYFAVAAVTSSNGIGLRSNATVRPEGIFNCDLAVDLAISQLVYPPRGNIPNCFTISSKPLEADLVNNGTDSIFSFTASYSINGGTVVNTTVNDTIAPGATYTFISAANLSISTSGITSTNFWVTINGDGNSINDSISASTQFYTGQSKAFPYTDDLEANVPQCNTGSDCGATSCALSGGWYNYPGVSIDGSDWRGNSGVTPSSNTGPSTDQNPGTASGTYLYIESSDCFNNQAWVQTPCVDLSNTTNPLFSFYYHMYGADMGDLFVDVFDGERWTLGAFNVSGDQSNAWNKATFNLIDYIGKTVFIRFRGITGSDFTSDIAIDNISFQENTSAPSALYSVSSAVTCINGTVNLTSNSTNFPNALEWSVTPSNTATFVNGDSTSNTVSITFSAAGNYTIRLIATNATGSDTLTQTAAITASAGATLSAFEDFEANGIPNTWAVVNPDGFTEWEAASVIESNGNTGTAVRFDNFTNPVSNTRDDLVGINVDLISQTDALLYFDLAYAPALTATNDSLIILVSSDCGTTFIRTAYAKGASALASTTAQNTRFVPSSANQWKSDSLDLTPFIGQNIKVNFVAKSARGNALYLDNIQLVNGLSQAPNITLSTTNTFFCEGDTVEFQSTNSGGVVSTYSWNFGTLALPKTATGPGPHKIIYLSSGNQIATLNASNSGGVSNDQQTLIIGLSPISLFQTTATSFAVTFTDQSINDPTTWNWDFGDGNTSTLQNPLHTYASAGTYTVTQTVSNACGKSTRTSSITVFSDVSLSESLGIKSAQLYPNPGKENFYLSVDVLAETATIITISDLSGKTMLSKMVTLKTGKNTIPLKLTQVANGIYIVNVKTELGEISLRALKQ